MNSYSHFRGYLAKSMFYLLPASMDAWIDSVPESTRISQKSSDVHAAESETAPKKRFDVSPEFRMALNWVILKRKNMEKLVTG